MISSEKHDELLVLIDEVSEVAEVTQAAKQIIVDSIDDLVAQAEAGATGHKHTGRLNLTIHNTGTQLLARVNYSVGKKLAMKQIYLS